jgi:hypothetical protein
MMVRVWVRAARVVNLHMADAGRLEFICDKRSESDK